MKKLRELFWGEIGKYTFLSACIIMCVVHVYVYTNMILNHDSVNYYLTGEDMEYYVGCGRWMLYLITRISGIQTLTPLICLISIVSISAACTLMVDLFGVYNKLLIICFNIIVVTFPSVSNSFCYMYNADGIFIAYFLSVLCVWLLEKNCSKILAAFLLVLVCGMYQVYWSMSVALAFMVMLLYYLLGIRSTYDLRRLASKCMTVYGSSIIGYLVLNKLILMVMQIAPAGYAGLNAMLEFGGVRQIIGLIANANIQVARYYFIKGSFCESNVLVIINVLLLLGGGVFCIGKISVKHKRNSVILSILGICLVPTVLNNISVAGKGTLHSVMMMSFVIPYLCVIAYLQYELSQQRPMGMKLSKLVIILILIIGYHNILTTNKVYARQELNYEATYGYLNRMLMRIEQMEEYQSNPDIKICFINETANEKFHITILAENPSINQEIFAECDDMVATNNGSLVKNIKDIYDFYDNFLGISLSRVSDEEYFEIGRTNEFEEMEVYPANNSIKVINGVLTVKVAEGR